MALLLYGRLYSLVLRRAIPLTPMRNREILMTPGALLSLHPLIFHRQAKLEPTQTQHNLQI
jgi:hypothetical protein